MNFSEIKLFDGISMDECRRMIDCFNVRIKRYVAGSVIQYYDGTNGAVGILAEGRAELVRIDQHGNRTVLEFLQKNDLFGETIAFASPGYDSITVNCTEDAEVAFIDYDDITKRCENACAHHSRLVENMFRLIAEKARELTRRVEVLSGRTIRDKLLSCFRRMAADGGGNCFRLPFTVSALADYISADRSAMTRELKKMREEGLVRIDKKTVFLLDNAR